MAKYIDADKFHRRLFYMRYVDKIEELGVFEALDNEPAADVEPVRHGKWIKTAVLNPRCSVCKKWAICDKNAKPILTDYCPNCGAKMDIE